LTTGRRSYKLVLAQWFILGDSTSTRCVIRIEPGPASPQILFRYLGSIPSIFVPRPIAMLYCRAHLHENLWHYCARLRNPVCSQISLRRLCLSQSCHSQLSCRYCHRSDAQPNCFLFLFHHVLFFLTEWKLSRRLNYPLYRLDFEFFQILFKPGPCPNSLGRW
jgi:hypothetical protein